MNVLRRNLFLMGILLLCTTVSFAQHVTTDYDRSVDFSRYKTYTWEHVHAQNPLWVDRIKAAVNSALAAKGWTEVESGGSVSIVGMEMTRSHHRLSTRTTTASEAAGAGEGGETNSVKLRQLRTPMRSEPWSSTYSTQEQNV
jgi:hypothetical protein